MKMWKQFNVMPRNPKYGLVTIASDNSARWPIPYIDDAELKSYFDMAKSEKFFSGYIK